MTKIKSINWTILFFANLLLYFLLSKRGDIQALPESIGRALGVLVLVLILLVLVRVFSFILRIKLESRSYTFLFMVFAVLISIVSLLANSTQREAFNTQKHVDKCIEEFKELSKTKPSIKQYDFEAYCECAAEKVKDIPLRDSAKYTDPNSAVYLDLLGPCWQGALINKRVIGVDAGMLPDTIDVLNLHNHIRVKVKMNGEEVYMIFDSGATDVLVGEDIIQDQIATSEIVYTGDEMDYEVADGSIISARIAVVKEFTIGEFTLKDLEIAVADQVPNPLLGKSVLDQFSSWTITSENKLILIP